MSVPGAGYVLSCCSTVDLTAAKLTSLRIGWLPYSYEAGGVVYLDDLWESRSPGEFYGELARGADAKTSRLNEGQYRDYFEGLASRVPGVTPVLAPVQPAGGGACVRRNQRI